mmetsp:Transcript_63041/g.148472  ORF Transcript_63041/g.148472 Transcript_63041/m.148472 type:complete len:220 (+) Transcript_63041:82-741(+)
MRSTRRLCRADADAGPAPARGHCGAAPAGAVAVSEGGQELGVGVAGRARVECQRRVDAAERDGEHGAYRRRLRAPLPWRPVRATPVPRTARRVGAVAPQRQASAARDAQLALDDIRPRRSGGFRVARQALVGPAEARDGLHPALWRAAVAIALRLPSRLGQAVPTVGLGPRCRLAVLCVSTRGAQRKDSTDVCSRGGGLARGAGGRQVRGRPLGAECAA